MKLILVLFVLIAAASSEDKRTEKFLDFLGIGDAWFPRCIGCPPWRCIRDNAVIKGYCCGCARVSDYLPINCHGTHISCPSDGRRLCKVYDYMLDCCCH